MRFGVLLLVLSTEWAQAPAPSPSGAIVLRAARLLDGKFDRVVSPGVVVVLGDKIRGVGPAAEIPAGARVIDLGDATLLPGFMDAHTHLSSPHMTITATKYSTISTRKRWSGLWMFGELVRLGMKPIEALRAGTSVDAELLGLADRTGSIEAGKLADILAVPGNPLDDIHVTERVLFVMKALTLATR